MCRTEDYGDTWTREHAYVNTVSESCQRSPEVGGVGPGTVKLSPESAGKYAETRCGLEADG